MSEHAEYLMVRRTGPTTPIACVGELRASRDGHELVCFEKRALPTGATLKRFDAEARQLSQHEIGVQADRDPERWSARLIGFTTAGLAYSVLSWKGRSEDIRCLAFIVDRTGVARLVASFDLPSMPTTISEQQHACNSDLIRNVYGEIVDEGIY